MEVPVALGQLVWNCFLEVLAAFLEKNWKPSKRKTKQLNGQTPCLLASLSFNMCEIVLQHYFVNGSFCAVLLERVWYSFKKMPLSVSDCLCVCVWVCNISFTRNEHFHGTVFYKKNIVLYMQHSIWKKEVVPGNVWHDCIQYAESVKHLIKRTRYPFEEMKYFLQTTTV